MSVHGDAVIEGLFKAFVYTFFPLPVGVPSTLEAARSEAQILLKQYCTHCTLSNR